MQCYSHYALARQNGTAYDVTWGKELACSLEAACSIVHLCKSVRPVSCRADLCRQSYRKFLIIRSIQAKRSLRSSCRAQETDTGKNCYLPVARNHESMLD